MCIEVFDTKLLIRSHDYYVIMPFMMMMMMMMMMGVGGGCLSVLCIHIMRSD